MKNRTTNIIAACLLVFVFIVALSSITNDSLTMDELAHLPAGYSYLTQKDMRLNPEHPPIIKDLSAVPLLFLENIKFPSEIKDWKSDVNGQWGFGNYFLFKTGNPAEQMIFLARIPMILILILAGFYIFRWAKQLWGNNAGLLALFLFSISPTFLAHGRLVTTDVGAAFGTIFASYYFIKFLEKSDIKSAIKAGLALGIAELLKFSLILLLPFFGLIAMGWLILKAKNFKNFLENFAKYIGFGAIIGATALCLIYFVYLYHVWNYPAERQKADTEFTLASFSNRNLTSIVIWMADKPILRPFSQYLLGLFMIFQRASGGNTGYFMGEVSASGWKTYFPIVYFIKETLTFHILTLISLLYLAYKWVKSLRFKASFQTRFSRLWNWKYKYFVELSMFLFIAIYWYTSLTSKLNIGVRHLLPVFPFTIMLVSSIITKWLKENKFQKAKYAIIACLLVFGAYSTYSVYPSFLSYFNEAVGGPKQGYKYVTDSNLDWGQDLKRLKIWLDQNNIQSIYLDYFGGSDTSYYLKEKYKSWWGDRNPNELKKGEYLAVSATLLQGGRGKPVSGFTQASGYYNWLNKYQPTAVIGNSIFVYKIE